MATSTLPPLGALRAFEAAARLESVTQAAAELHVTHGAVSRQIRLLEQALGQPLFERAGRGLALTGTGARLRDATSAAFSQLQQTWTALGQVDNSDTLVLGCSASVLARWVIPRLERMSQVLPDVRLHFSAQESPDLLPGVDAMLLSGQGPWPADWQVLELASEAIGPVIGTRHPGLAALQNLPATAVLNQRLLHTASRPQAWPQWALANQLDPQALQLGDAFPHLYYLLEAAVAGLGIAIAPKPLVAADIAARRLIAPWGFVETQAKWCLCHQRAKPDPRLVTLATWLAQELLLDNV